jgi:hypothetical protein
MTSARIRSQLLSKILDIVGVHQVRRTRHLLEKWRRALSRTQEKMGTGSLSDPWLHWPALMAQQAVLSRPPTNLEVVLERLQVWETVDPPAPAACSNCQARGVQLALCRRCLSAEWCSTDCMEHHWETGHHKECEELEERVFGEVTWEPGPAERHRQRANRLQGLYSAAKQQLQETEEERRGREGDRITDLTTQLKEMKGDKLKAQLQKGGLKRALGREKERREEKGEEQDEEERQEDSSDQMVRLTSISGPHDHVITFMRGDQRSKGSYKTSDYIKLSSTGRIEPNSKVSAQQVQRRARGAWKFLVFMSNGGLTDFESTEQQETRLLVEQIVRQNIDMFHDLLKNPVVAKLIYGISDEDTAMMASGNHQTDAQMRRWRTMLAKLGFNPLASQHKQRAHEKQVSARLNREDLETGKMPLFATAKAEFATLRAFVRQTRLSTFVSHLVREARARPCDDDSMFNLEHPGYKGYLWLLLAGDKGGDWMKLCLAVCVHYPFLLGMFKGTDNFANLAAYLLPMYEELERLMLLGVDVDGEVLEVKLLYSGDKEFLARLLGHAGSSSTFCSLYRMVTLVHLRRAHKDGSAHSPSQAGCQADLRTIDSVDMDLAANLADPRPGDTHTRSKHHHSICERRLVPARDILQFLSSLLHIRMAFVEWVEKRVKMEGRVADGTEEESAIFEVDRLYLEEGDAELEDAEEGEQEAVAEGGEDESNLKQRNQEERRVLDLEMETRRLRLTTLEEEERSMAASVSGMSAIMERVSFKERGDDEGLIQLAKKQMHSYYYLKRYNKNWGTDWRCEVCLLTGHDGRAVAWRRCGQCQQRVHAYCQLAEEDGEEEMTCRACSGLTSAQQLRETLEGRVREKVDQSREVAAVSARERLGLAELDGRRMFYMGETEKQLEEVLASQIKVQRNEYFTQGWIGRHADKIVQKFELLVEVMFML